MSSIEDRLLEYEQEHLNPYEKLRKLQARREQHKQMQHQQMAKEHASVEEVTETKTDIEVSKSKMASQKPQLKPKFKWGTDDDGEYVISPQQTQDIVRIEPETIKSQDRVLNFLGYDINLSAKLDFFKASYQKAFIEARSHNFLLAKFSELKAGAFQMILGALGVDTDELDALRKSAIKAAVEEIVILFEQNVYNTEVFMLFSGSKKDKAKVLVFEESRKQLISKMARLGEQHYFTQERENELQQKAVRRILQDLLEEKQNMEYQREYA